MSEPTTEQGTLPELDEAMQEVLDLLDSKDEIDLKPVTDAASAFVYAAIQNASNQTDRSQQQQDHFIGLSTLGHCRQYAALMVKQTPFSDERDKTPAFFGTVAGDAIEKQIKKDHPDWLTQGEVEFHIPSGGTIMGHFDIVVPASAATEEHPQAVWDLKSKAELESVKRYGVSTQQIFQIHAYTKACIDAGLLDPSKPIFCGDIFFDRSGRDKNPFTIAHVYSEDVIGFIDEWINDVKYAVLHGEDASRDMPREWCWSYCEYATVCRGNDTDVEGLVEDPEFLAGVSMQVEASELERRAKN